MTSSVRCLRSIGCVRGDEHQVLPILKTTNNEFHLNSCETQQIYKLKTVKPLLNTLLCILLWFRHFYHKVIVIPVLGNVRSKPYHSVDLQSNHSQCSNFYISLKPGLFLPGISLSPNLSLITDLNSDLNTKMSFAAILYFSNYIQCYFQLHWISAPRFISQMLFLWFWWITYFISVVCKGLQYSSEI